MQNELRQRVKTLRHTLEARGILHALFTDEASIAYLAGVWGYLGMEFGRPTMLLVSSDRDPIIITPLMESEMVGEMSWVEDIRTWEDSGARSWQAVLQSALGHEKTLYVERDKIPAPLQNFLRESLPEIELENIEPILGAQRMIKSDAEIEIMKQAGEIGGAMMKAAHQSLRAGTREYESALAVIEAGTQQAATLLSGEGWDRFVSPLIHNLQILQSGTDTSMVHRRASTRVYQAGDPVYFCFCNMIEFKHYRLGFDRMFHIESVSDEAACVQEAAIEAQQAAIASIREGVMAQDVARAANAVYADRGFETGYRTGRSIGVSYLEAPELKEGDETVLRAGMTFAVDGGISVDGVTAGRIGDSVVVTKEGCEYLTDYPRTLLVTQP